MPMFLESEKLALVSEYEVGWDCLHPVGKGKGRVGEIFSRHEVRRLLHFTNFVRLCLKVRGALVACGCLKLVFMFKICFQSNRYEVAAIPKGNFETNVTCKASEEASGTTEERNSKETTNNLKRRLVKAEWGGALCVLTHIALLAGHLQPECSRNECCSQKISPLNFSIKISKLCIFDSGLLLVNLHFLKFISLFNCLVSLSNRKQLGNESCCRRYNVFKLDAAGEM